MVPPEAPQAVSIGLRNCYAARFEHPLKASKASKAPQQLSKAFEPQNPPQQLAKASRLLCRASKLLYVARFEHPLKASKASKALQQLSKAIEPQNPPQQLAKASRLLCHGTSRGPTSCFYWASKLLRGTFSATSPGPTSCFYWASKLLCGTFWTPLKSLKSLKAPQQLLKAFGLWTVKPSAAACEGVLPTLPCDLPRPPQAISIGLRNCYVARFGHPLKASKASKKASRAPQQLPKAFEL